MARPNKRMITIGGVTAQRTSFRFAYLGCDAVSFFPKNDVIFLWDTFNGYDLLEDKIPTTILNQIAISVPLHLLAPEDHIAHLVPRTVNNSNLKKVLCVIIVTPFNLFWRPWLTQLKVTRIAQFFCLPQSGTFSVSIILKNRVCCGGETAWRKINFLGNHQKTSLTNQPRFL